jgi:hypothetical integral membrane protein (TIGR02206 family)
MRQFSDPHLAALAVLVVATAVAIWTGRRHPGAPTEVIAYVLAGVILAAWAGEYVADVVRGTWSVTYDLPLQLTDAVSVAAALALITRHRLLVELTYFWSLTASLQATLTPDLGQKFPSVYYFTYFGYHVGAIVAGCLLVFGCGLYPRPRAAWRTFGITLAFAAVSGAADLVTGGNYMYLRTKPQHNSLLGVLGPWPWYIVGGALLGLALLLVAQRLADWVSRRDPRQSTSQAPAGPDPTGTVEPMATQP